MYGKRIKYKRRLFGLTRDELAERIGAVPIDIQLWEEEQMEPQIQDLINLAAEFETSVDWLIGAIDDCDDSAECEVCDEFMECKLIPHMQNFIEENDEPAYIHIQMSENEDNDGNFIFSGTVSAVLSAINLLLKSLSNECGIDYYDIVAWMASSYAAYILEKEDKGESEDE